MHPETERALEEALKNFKSQPAAIRERGEKLQLKVITPRPTRSQYEALFFRIWGSMMNSECYEYFLSAVEANLSSLEPPPQPNIQDPYSTNCKICGKWICDHGKITIRGSGVVRCNLCGEEVYDEPLSKYSLPFTQETVDLNSETHFRTCKDCYLKHTKQGEIYD